MFTQISTGTLGLASAEMALDASIAVPVDLVGGAAAASITPSADVLSLTSNSQSARWNISEPVGTGVVVTYTFATTAATYDTTARPGFAAYSAAQKASVHQALDTWAAASGVTFIEVPEAVGGQIRFGMYDMTGVLNSVGAQASGFGYYPQYINAATPTGSAPVPYLNGIGGDLFLNANYYAGNDTELSPGQRGYSIILHEIGHTLGFKHPFEGTPVIDPAHDSAGYTVMSYNRPNSTTALGSVDVEASQYYYGVTDPNYSWNATTLTLTQIGTAGADYILGIELKDLISAGDGNDTLRGQLGDDTIFAGQGSDYVSGGDGNDTIVGNADIFGQESDTLDGGNGDDTIYGEFTDTISGGAGFDILYAVNAYDWSINLGTTGIELMIADFGNDTIDASTQSTGVEVVASGGNDVVTGSNFNDRLWGGTGNDTMNGGFGDDMLFGDVGADQLSAGGGNDILYVDASDTIDGGSGFDVVYITTGAGMTINMAATGVEFVIDFSGGNNVIDATGLAIGANIYTGGGNDTITGSANADVLWGLAGNDIIGGGLGDDVLVGGTGSDRLTPGAGVDRIYANSGGGGDGAVDTAVFSSGWGKDTIYDFEHGVDKIDLHALGTSFAALSITSAGGSAVVTLGADQIVVNGLAGVLSATDFTF